MNDVTDYSLDVSMKNILPVFEKICLSLENGWEIKLKTTILVVLLSVR